MNNVPLHYQSMFRTTEQLLVANYNKYFFKFTRKLEGVENCFVYYIAAK